MQQVVNVPEGTPNQTSLGFIANTVTVNNITQSWAYIPAAQAFIPPYQYGVVIPLPGTDNVDIQWQTPTSLPVGPVGTGTLAATYTDTSLAPSNGVSVFSQQTSLILGSAPPGSTLFVLPAGCQALMLVPPSTAAAVSYVVTALGTPANGCFGTGTGPVGTAVIVPVSALLGQKIQVNNTGGFAFEVLALFTAQPEPIQDVAITGAVSISGTVSENLTEVAGVAVANTVPGMLDVNLEDVGGASLAAHAAGTVPVDIRDVGGSPSGALNVNIADLNGSASVVGQELMAASFPVVIASDQSDVKVALDALNAGVKGQQAMASSLPVVIASDQSAVAENLTQVGGSAITEGQKLMASSLPVVIASDQSAVPISAASALPENLTQIRGVNVLSVTGFKAGALPVEGWSQYGLAGAQSNLFLQVVQRPTINLLTVNLNVIVAGTILIAAPGIGTSIVLRKIRITPSVAALAPDSIVLGTTLTGTNLAIFRIPTAAAASPQAPEYMMDYDDFLVGDNLPVDISSNVATFVNTGVMITYCFVTTATWPTV